MDADGDLVDTLNLYYGCSVVAITYKCIQHKKFVNCRKNKRKKEKLPVFFLSSFRQFGESFYIGEV